MLNAINLHQNMEKYVKHDGKKEVMTLFLSQMRENLSS
jgi:hypothetical protein